jgi:DegV family protein with EDD domain
MKVAIMTDENSGMLKADAERLGIFIMPMPFFVNGELTYESESFTKKDFYAKLAEGADVSTSQPSPGDVMDMWDSILEKGYDEIVYIPMSSALSESYNSAKIFAEEYDGKIHVVDNHRISITMEQSVIDAVNYVAEGMTGAAIKERLEKEAYEATIYITVEDLNYLKRGGRVTAAAAAIGNILNLKPVLTIPGTKLDVYAKERGMKKARRTMIEAMKKDIADKFQKLYDEGNFRIFAVYSDADEETLESWKAEISEAFPGMEIDMRALSLSIGCHIGPGALAVAGCMK